MAEIEILTLWDVHDLFDYWQDHPPMHVLVAAYLMGAGTHRPAKKPARENANRFGELEQTVATVGGNIRKRLPEIYQSAKSSS